MIEASFACLRSVQIYRWVKWQHKECPTRWPLRSVHSLTEMTLKELAHSENSRLILRASQTQKPVWTLRSQWTLPRRQHLPVCAPPHGLGPRLKCLQHFFSKCLDSVPSPGQLQVLFLKPLQGQSVVCFQQHRVIFPEAPGCGFMTFKLIVTHKLCSQCFKV